MRKLLLVCTMSTLLIGSLFSSFIYAEVTEPIIDDGIVVVGWEVGNSNDATIKRPVDLTPDINNPKPESQVVEATLEANAYIPCYIRMDINGNEAKATAESFGPGAISKISASNQYYLVFDNEIGGFCDANWKPIAAGKNAEIRPDEGMYIRGCDTFKVSIYANDSFRYDVVAGPLQKVDAVANAGDSSLTLDMRTQVDGGVWLGTISFNNNFTTTIAERKACQTLTALHQFRVPYKKTTAQGHYKGNITFKAYLI